MKQISFLLLGIFLFQNIHAQTGKPLIGSDNDIKQKITQIKNAFPDLVKAFGRNGQTSYGITRYNTDLKIGKSMIDLSESSEGQKLKITFSDIYYKGTKEDFKKFLQDLVIYVKDIFGDSYYSKPQQEGSTEQVFFYEQGKDILSSPTVIYVSYDANIGINVQLNFSTGRKI